MTKLRDTLTNLRKDPLQKSLGLGALVSLYCGVHLGSWGLDRLASAFILLALLSGMALRKLRAIPT